MAEHDLESRVLPQFFPAHWLEEAPDIVFADFPSRIRLVFPMRYGLDDTHLQVRFGICRQRIPLADILEVHPTRNPLSSPALSLDRLHVQFGQGIFKTVMISPAERSRFLDDLAKTAGLKREGDRLVRA